MSNPLIGKTISKITRGENDLAILTFTDGSYTFYSECFRYEDGHEPSIEDILDQHMEYSGDYDEVWDDCVVVEAGILTAEAAGILYQKGQDEYARTQTQRIEIQNLREYERLKEMFGDKDELSD